MAESADDFPDLTDEELDSLSEISASDVEDAMTNAPGVLRPYLDATTADEDEGAAGG